MCKKYLKNAYFAKYQNSWSHTYQNNNVALEKDKIQHCLLVMLEKWQAVPDMGKCFGAILKDLLKAFDCLPHDLLLEKLHALDFNITDLRLIRKY